MYYPCSENKDADQLRGYREADLRLCFRPCKLLVFSRTGSFLFGYGKSVFTPQSQHFRSILFSVSVQYKPGCKATVNGSKEGNICSFSFCCKKCTLHNNRFSHDSQQLASFCT